MKRREFIQVMLPIAGLPVVWPMWPFAQPMAGRRRRDRPVNFPDDGRVLVLIQAAGGNDGLNTIVPHTNDIYYRERPRLAIPQNEVIDINGEIGFNNVLAPLMPMYDAGNLSVVQGVGYPNPNRSHFRSTDIWMTGSSSDDVMETGWLGRYFDAISPEGEACGTYGPPAIQIGLTSSLALLGREQKGIALQDPIQFYELVSRQGGGHDPQPRPEPRTPAEYELEFLRDTAASAFQFAGEIVEAYESVENKAEYPGTSLAEQLSIVARMIAGGLSTRIYIVSIRGFDTHAAQANTHLILLGELAGGIASFQKDMEQLELADRVVGFYFSEFGRRVRENASAGTDHGTAAPLFLFGQPVTGGIHGAHPDLSNLDSGDLRHLIDYRQLYATLLEQWLAGDPETVLGEGFTTLPLIQGTTDVKDSGVLPTRFSLAQNYPNPFNPETTIEYALPRTAHVEVGIYNSLGQRMDLLVDSQQPAGRYKIVWQANGHPSGAYFIKLRAGDFEASRRMSLVK